MKSPQLRAFIEDVRAFRARHIHTTPADGTFEFHVLRTLHELEQGARTQLVHLEDAANNLPLPFEGE